MSRYVRIVDEGKVPTFVNPKQICYILDKGSRACELIMACGGDLGTGLPGGIRVNMSAELFIEKYLGEWE